jgi:crotonobetainyl-CoA:carnitine CoA-transferase CaiB-like acyl-CoA transferase
MTEESARTTERQAAADGLASPDAPGMLSGLTVIEYADETAEYCGLLLAGLGAEVIKIEPPEGAPTRLIAPFRDEKIDKEQSLYFWAYNRGKRSAVLDLDSDEGKAAMLQLLAGADILLDSSSGGLNTQLGLARKSLAERFPSLIVARMTPFGDDGPWSSFKGSDLVHLALGGVMMNCGYDPNPANEYDLPPIAPQIWHAYHIAGEQLLIGVLAALIERRSSGLGQDVSCAIHEAVAKNTELDLMSWVMRRAPLYRLTCRHASETVTRVPSISHTKDGRWFMTWGVGARDRANLAPFLDRYGMAADLRAPEGSGDSGARNIPGTAAADEQSSHTLEVIQRFVRSYTYDKTPWSEAQAAGLLWAPVRKPHESVNDEHWLKRGAISEIFHPEAGRSFPYPTSKWLSSETRWQPGRRAPLIGEDTHEVLRRTNKAIGPAPAVSKPVGALSALSARGRPFALQNVRILDFSWFLASAGGTRFAAALGAESIKVEWKENPDTRLAAMAPVGGREARKSASAALQGVTDRIWAASTTIRIPASAAFRSTFGTPRAWRSRGASSPFPTLSRRASPPACLTVSGSTTTSSVKYAPTSSLFSSRAWAAMDLMDACGRSGRSPAHSPERITCRVCRSPRCPPVGAIPTSTGWALMASRKPCSGRSTTAP